jgi:CheY-like chemotaxis protein
MCALRAIVTDDDRDSASVLALLLERMFDCEATVCDDGPTCVVAIQRVQPAIVFLDLQMPGMDGITVVRHVQQFHRGASPLFVALTGLGGTRLQQVAREAGFDHYELKPISAVRIAELLVEAAQRVEVLSCSQAVACAPLPSGTPRIDPLAQRR